MATGDHSEENAESLPNGHPLGAQYIHTRETEGRDLGIHFLSGPNQDGIVSPQSRSVSVPSLFPRFAEAFSETKALKLHSVHHSV